MRRRLKHVSSLAAGFGIVAVGFALMTGGHRASRRHLEPGRQPHAAARVTPAGTSSDGNRDQVLKAYAKLPLTFVENRGQTDTRVRYVAQGSRNAFYLTREEIVLSFVKGSGPRDSTLAARAARIRPVATAAAAEQPTLGVGLARSGLV